jgi:hypothetical protein
MGMIVFLHIPKTAGSSFHFVLENNLGVSFCHTGHTQTRVFNNQDLTFAKKIFPNLRGIGGHNLVAPLSLSSPDVFHMTFLREPLSRVLSNYQEKVIHRQRRGQRVVGFEEALQTDEELGNLQVKLMAGSSNLEEAKRYLRECQFVGLTEKFDLSMHVLQKSCPFPLDVRYKKSREQSDNRIRKQLEADPHAMELLRDHNRLDMELYEYAVREIFPRLCRQAGFEPDQKTSSLDTFSSRMDWRRRFCRFYNRIVYRNLCKLRRQGEPFNWNDESAVKREALR